jgi:hypothetical protein
MTVTQARPPAESCVRVSRRLPSGRWPSNRHCRDPQTLNRTGYRSIVLAVPVRPLTTLAYDQQTAKDTTPPPRPPTSARRDAAGLVHSSATLLW